MHPNDTKASLLRRFAAIFYDLLLLLALLFVATAVAVGLNRGNAVTHPVYYLSLAIISFVFYGWFWTKGGQTLGLRTWRLKLTGMNGEAITWKQAFIRFLSAFISFLPAGAGFFWMLLDKESQTLHDRLSSTRMIKLPKIKT